MDITFSVAAYRVRHGVAYDLRLRTTEGVDPSHLSTHLDLDNKTCTLSPQHATPMAHTTQHNVHSALPRKMHLFPSRLQVHAMCTTTSRHERCHNGFSQCTGASAANGVVHKGKCGDGPIHLVILHKHSAAITATMQYQVPLGFLSNGLGTHRSKRTEDSRVKGCPALSCHVSSSPVVSQHVLLLSQQAVSTYPECGFGTVC